MEERHAYMLKQHRNKFVQSVSKVELLLYPMLHRFLSASDIHEIERASEQPNKVAKLLDILPTKGSQVFSTLCLALETTYPHLLTVMFLGNVSSHSLYGLSPGLSPTFGQGSSQSTVSSYTSESDIEDSKGPHQLLQPQNGIQENGASGGISDEGNLNKLDGSSQNRSYDQLQRDCKKAMMNLDILRHQHAEVVKKCEHATKEGEFYRRQNQAAVSNADTLRSELQTIKQEYTELSAERDRAQQEINDLRQLHDDDSKDIQELHRQNHDIMNQTASSEVLKRMYDAILNKHENLKKHSDTLRKQYADLMSVHSIAQSKYETSDEEIRRLRALNDTIQQELEAAQKERHSLKQQCTAFIRHGDMAKRERDAAVQKEMQATDKFTKTLKEANHIKKIKQDLESDFKRVSKERDAAIREYTLVMSERDVVHKDIEKLQNDVEREVKRRHARDEEFTNLQAYSKELEHKLAVICEERDSILREWNELSECYRDMINNTVQVQQERDKALKEFEKYKEERDVARRERTEALVQRDQLLQQYYSAAQQQKSMCSEYDQVNKEMECLRREVATLSKDLKEMQKESDSAKQQRDFAFSERDKIVQERESVRTLCDKLRRDRDRAVSDYAEALRQSDDVKRQKNEMSKQLKEVREKVSQQAEKESRMKQLVAHQSKDSAIGDAGSQEWETETIEFETERDEGDVSLLGFDIGDGKDNPQIPDDCSLIITKVDKGSLADGRLKVNDCVVKVNNVDLTNVGDRTIALQAVKNSRGIINMVVKRRRLPGARQCTVRLFLSSKDHGITMEPGIFISRIAFGSVAAKEGCLFVGDRIISVNGLSVENRAVNDVEKLLDGCDAVMLNVVRLASPMSSSGLPSSASPTVSSYKSGHETSSSKSSLTHLLSPHELTSSEGEGRTAKHTSQLVNIKDKSQYEDFSSDWPNTSQQQYSSERNHANSEMASRRTENPWEERRDTGSVRRRTDIPIQTQNRSSYGGSTHYQQQSRDGSFIGSPSRLSVKEKKRHSFHQSQGSGDSVRENKHVTTADNRHEQLANQCLVIKNESQELLRNNADGPPGYIDPPPAHSRQGSPMMGSLTEQRRQKSSRSEINRTWPKSHKPPDIYRNGRDSSGRRRKKTKRRTAIPLMMSPSYESMSADEENDDESELVPPIPPSRTSSFKASLRHQQPVAGTSPTSTPGQQLQSKLPGASPDRVAKSDREDRSSGADRTDNSLYAMHYAAISLPDTNVDFSNDSPNAAFRPISTPSIIEQAKSNSAIQNHPQRPNQLEVARYHSPQQNPYARRTPSPSQYYERRYGYGNRSSSESMPGLLTVEPSNATLVRLRNHVPYFTVCSQPLADPKQTAGFPRTRPGPRASIHSLSSEDDPSRAPSRNSLPERNMRMSFPAHDLHHSLEFPPDGMYTPEGYHRMPPGYDPSGANRFNSLPVKRMRIPSSRNSPSSGGQSNSSLEKGGSLSLSLSSGGERDSPLSPGSVGSFTKITEPVVRTTPGKNPDDPREIAIEKSTEPLGITINENNGGIFIQSVQKESLAARAKMKIGDQILEFNGINLRQANYKLAANIISQAGKSINIRVQYKKLSPMDHQRDSIYSSNQSTPVATPSSTRTNSPTLRPQSDIISDCGTMTPPTPRASRTYSENSQDDNNSMPPNEPRFVFLKKSTQTSDNLGMSFCGGNHHGIFVSEIQEGSMASKADIGVGDQVLELNGYDMRKATAEQAHIEFQKAMEQMHIVSTTDKPHIELQKAMDEIHILAQFNISKFKRIQGRHGDALFVRAMTDYSGENDNELSFKKDDVLYIEDTMCNGVLGVWSAWRLDMDGQKTVHGQMPSKTKLEEELARRRSITEGLQEEELRTASSRRREGPARRSFFRRKNKHQRNNSKDSRELSEGSITDVPVQEESILPTYQRVERCDFHAKRPVLLLGPLTDKVAAKLTEESTEKFLRCAPQMVKSSIQNMEKELSDNVYLDYQRRDSHFECIPTENIKDICKKGCHCILEGIPPTICKERLGLLQLFPIIIFVKFKSAKQIKEQKDPFFLPERLTNRQAKDLFESANKLEQEYKPHFDDTVNGGNLASICTKVKKVIDREQHKANFIPSTATL